MSDSYTNLLYHLIFSTKDRRPLITPDKEIRLYEYMGGIVRELGGISLELNGTEDHVHQLAKLRPDKAVSDVLRDLKSNASGCCIMCFHRRKIFHGNEGMEHSQSVSRMLKMCGTIFDVRRSTT